MLFPPALYRNSKNTEYLYWFSIRELFFLCRITDFLTFSRLSVILAVYLFVWLSKSLFGNYLAPAYSLSLFRTPNLLRLRDLSEFRGWRLNSVFAFLRSSTGDTLSSSFLAFGGDPYAFHWTFFASIGSPGGFFMGKNIAVDIPSLRKSGRKSLLNAS